MICMYKDPDPISVFYLIWIRIPLIGLDLGIPDLDLQHYSQHENTNSQEDLVLKIQFKTFLLKISGMQK